MSKKKTDIRAYVIAGVGALIMGGVAVGAILDPQESLDKKHCFLTKPPPETLIVALDISDPLIDSEPRSIGFSIDQLLARLGKGDRIVAVDVPGKSPSEIMPVIDVCHPGDGDNTARNAFSTEVTTPLQTHLHQAQSLLPSQESPIIEFILGIAADPSLHRAGSELHVFLATDGLQNSPTTSVYRRGSEFPKISGKPLQGIAVDLFVVRNERDLALQPQAVARLKDWLTAAGATVVLREPSWLPLADVKKKGGKK